MKKALLILFVAGLGSALSVNAQQGPQCKGGQCQRGQHKHRILHPVWRDVKDNNDEIIPSIIEVHENNLWVEYQKSAKNCPPTAHHHRQWQNHKHEHSHEKAQGQHGHAHPHEHHRHHVSGRRVKYQRDQNGKIIDGVMNVQEKDGKCWQYTRTSTTRTIEASDQAFIEKMQQSLEVE